MARDVFIRLHRCQYCDRPGFAVWDADLFTCDHGSAPLQREPQAA